MFSDCYDLKYINFKKITIQENTTIGGLIYPNSPNQILCIDDKPSFNKVISFYNCTLIDCSLD